MSKVIFEEDEMMILAIFACDTRKDTMEFITEAVEFVEQEEEELLQIMHSAIYKLNAITDEIFKGFTLSDYLYEVGDGSEA